MRKRNENSVLKKIYVSGAFKILELPKKVILYHPKLIF